ncbi:GTP-binding protein [Serratia symbiotica str. 'Cinara cedri']|nr:GTP-binding protein [Serratia symbiotica str. 'Cinara cedri']
MSEERQYCGFISIVGRPNVGKSTLLNQLLGKKVSITSRKPQTTRHCIMGISTQGIYQVIYIDTPGLHVKETRAINRLMNRAASSSLSDVALVMFVVAGTYWTADDQMVLDKLIRLKSSVLLVINKVDKITNKSKLLPHIAFLNNKMNFFNIVLVSAKQGAAIDTIASIVRNALPEAEHYFSSDCITNCSQSFIVSEIIREKLIRSLGKELPYSVTVQVEQFMLNKQGSYDICVSIIVEREGQKKIVIGNKGAKIKIIGNRARKDMEKMFNVRVHLKLWVKVKSGWADNERTLHALGYIGALI